MTLTERYDRMATGIISGILLPAIVALFVFIFAKGDPTFSEWLRRITLARVETHIISLCVFPNVIIFLIFNQLDMLRATRGVLGITIVWAVIVFVVKVIL